MQEFAACEFRDVPCNLMRLVDPSFSRASLVQWHRDDQGIAQIQTHRKRFRKPGREFQAVVEFERLDNPVDRKVIRPDGHGATEMRRVRQTPATYLPPWAGQSANGTTLFKGWQILATATAYWLLRAGTGT